MPSHTNPKVSLGASVPVASSRFQSVIRHFSELGILAKIMGADGFFAGMVSEAFPQALGQGISDLLENACHAFGR